MKRYSPVGPISLLMHLQTVGLIDSYQLILAHEVATRGVQYVEFIYNFRAEHKNHGTIILDNSLIELGNSVDLGLMQRAVTLTKPNFVVLPDVLMNREASIKVYTAAYEPWKCLIHPMFSQFMAVVQGETEADVMQCAHDYIKYDHEHGRHLGALGVPRALANRKISRASLARNLVSTFGLPLHMMGMSEDFGDDMLAAAQFNVMGIDSATPLRAGWEGLHYGKEKVALYPTETREAFFDKASRCSVGMAHNIGYIRGMLNGMHRQM